MLDLLGLVHNAHIGVIALVLSDNIFLCAQWILALGITLEKKSCFDLWPTLLKSDFMSHCIKRFGGKDPGVWCS